MFKRIGVISAILLFAGMIASAYAGLDEFKDEAGSVRIAGGTAHIPVMKEMAEKIMATNPKITSQFMNNSYKTSDCFVSSGYPMTGIIEYANNSDALFVNPTTYDFRIKDLNFSGISTAGDPRWK